MFRPQIALLLGLVLVLGHAPAWLHVSQCGCVDRQWVNPISAASSESIGSLAGENFALAAVQPCDHAGCRQTDVGTIVDECCDIVAAACCSPSACASGHGCQSEDSESSHHDSETCVVCQSLAAPTGFVTPILELNASELAPTEQVMLTDSRGLVFSSFLPPSRGPPPA